MGWKKLMVGCILLSVICILFFLPAFAETKSASPINISNFSKQSTLYSFDDGSWLYFANCFPKEKARYRINIDFRCWGTDVLTIFPQMTVVIWDEGMNGRPVIIADKITIQVAGNAYEYQLIERNTPWNSNTRAGVTFLLPSDDDLLKDFASAKECTLVAEAGGNTFTWLVTGESYEDAFLPFIQDMLKYDFLHHVEENETNKKILMYSSARTVYKNVGAGLITYDSGQEPEEGYSFSEDSSAITQAKGSVFYVEMYDEQKNCLGNASGFVSFDEHYFVTNEHVVDGASYLIVWDENDKSYILNKVIAIDKDHDIAMIEFTEGAKYVPLKLDTESTLRRGMPVVAIGSKGLQVTSSIGVISAFPVLEQYAGIECVQYSASTARESNGGCLIGDNGKVIGVTSAISSEGQYIGVAVPVRYLIELYTKLKSNVYNVMDSSGANNSDTLKENGKKREDPTIITNGKMNTIVPISNDFDLDPFIMDKMNITVQEFLNKYEDIKRTTVKNAPSINSQAIEEVSSWDREYRINLDPDAGVGTRLLWKVEKGSDTNNLNVPLEFIVQFYRVHYHNTSLKENTRACLAVFSDDEHLMDKMIDFYNKNECEYNSEYAGLLTSDGYLITYFKNDLNEAFQIYYVSH